MFISSVQIANLALSETGTDSTIESLTENSAEANVINLWFEHARKIVLSGFNWSFARKRVLLATHTDSPSSEWGYRYVYPSDCLKVRFIENPAGQTADPVPFTIEQANNGTRSILTNEGTATVIYTEDISNTALYTPFFIETFAIELAGYICFALTGKLRLSNFLKDRAKQMMGFAAVIDNTEKQETAPRDASCILARN